MSLYSHVQSKQDLLEGALAVAIQPARPAGDGEWWEQVAHMVREHRAAFLRHPWALDVAMQRRVTSAEAWRGAEETLRLLRQHLTPARSARWIQILISFANGFLLAEREQRRGDFKQAAEDLAEKSPLVSEAAGRSARAADRDFEAGLQALVVAMRADATRGG